MGNLSQTTFDGVEIPAVAIMDAETGNIRGEDWSKVGRDECFQHYQPKPVFFLVCIAFLLLLLLNAIMISQHNNIHEIVAHAAEVLLT